MSPRTLVALPETRITSSVGQPPAWAATRSLWNFPGWRSSEASQGGLAGEGQPAWASRGGLASSRGINP